MLTLPPQVDMALAMLEEAGFEAFLVGGAVRDHLRGTGPAKDWDLATNARPEEVKRVFSGQRLIETGLKHGTVTVAIGHMPVEISTFRVDGRYSDHRRPDEVRFTSSLREDLERRDFTMNALAYHPRLGVIDHHGGIADLENGLVRCVGDPERRFREDALRILRGLRFAAVFDMRIEGATAAAIHGNRELLRWVAAERVRAELTRLLCGRGAGRALREFSDVVAVCIPELAPMFGFQQHTPYHDRDVWEHTLAVVDAIRAEPVPRWAALLHDIGKPHCFTLDADGVGHFYGHGERGAELAGAILGRLRSDTAGRERILQLIGRHDRPIAAERRPVKRLLNELGAEAAGQLIELHRADTMGKPAAYRDRLAGHDRAAAILEELLREEACFSRRDLAVDGADMLALGLRGREVGAALSACLEAVLDEKLPNERAALIAYVRGGL